jgi:hypothetical protein
VINDALITTTNGYILVGPSGVFSNQGGIVLAEGQISISAGGSLTNAGSITGTSGGVYLADAGYLSNAGLISLAGASHYAEGGEIGVTGTFDNSGQIRLAMAAQGYYGTASITIGSTGTLTNSGHIFGAGTIVNLGHVVSADAPNRTAVIDTASFINQGTVDIAAGTTLAVGSAVYDQGGQGVFDLSSGADLGFSHTVSQGETVAFLQSATLTLGDPAGFAGLLSGLVAGDVIDFAKRDVISAVDHGKTLVVGFGGGATVDLRLAAPLPAGDRLVLTRDGRGGTDLTITPPASHI